MNLIYESELKHHGIKGQKWGVRRFRNNDGSLTPAGKKRYSAKEQMQKDEFGLTKKEAKFKIKTAKKIDAKNHKVLLSTSTGKNWDNVKDANRKAVENDKTIKKLEKQKQHFEDQKFWTNRDSVQEAIYDAFINETVDAIDKRKKEIGSKYTDAYSEALLKDIGYEDNVEKGKRMLKAYGIENSFGKY